MKLRETATDFLVWPATFLGVMLVGEAVAETSRLAYLDNRLMPRPWAAQKESTM
jgi:hypothetical protein